MCERDLKVRHGVNVFDVPRVVVVIDVCLDDSSILLLLDDRCARVDHFALMDITWASAEEEAPPPWLAKMVCFSTFLHKNSMFIGICRQIVCFCPPALVNFVLPWKKVCGRPCHQRFFIFSIYQYFTSAFLVLKFYAQLFSNYSFALQFFGTRILVKKLLIK